MAEPESVTLNILSLDGGGVRGLSTLIILRKLLCLVNVEINGGNLAYSEKPANPTEVFDIIVGTSTGGLIALMLIKMAMGVDECIKAYRKLSEEIFKQWHYIGVLKGGFGRVKKYCGKNLRRIIVDQIIVPHLDPRSYHPQKYEMEDDKNHQNLECSVVCNELTKDMEWTGNVMFLCSKRCRRRNRHAGVYERVLVADAARATSAAPTYFSHVALLGTILVDGGFGRTNNPSLAALQHYAFKGWHSRDQQDRWQTSDLKYQMINIGTGSHPQVPPGRKGWRRLVPTMLRDVSQTLKNLQSMATEADNVGKDLDYMVQDSKVLTLFDRFSADRGNIHTIGLDAYKRLDEIEKLTGEYLCDNQVSDRLKQVAEQLARVIIARKRKNSVSVQTLFERRIPDRLAPQTATVAPVQSSKVSSLSGSESPTQEVPILTKLELEESVPSLAQADLRHAQAA